MERCYLHLWWYFLGLIFVNLKLYDGHDLVRGRDSGGEGGHEDIQGGPQQVDHTPLSSNIVFSVLMHVEPSKGGSWKTESVPEMTAPMNEVTAALTPDKVAFQLFKLPVPSRATKVTITAEADTGA